MNYKIRDFSLTLIDDPSQAQVVAWERSARALRTDDAKPIFSEIMDALNKISVTASDLKSLLSTFQIIASALKKAIAILNENETLTLTANRGVMVKAAISAGWIISPELTAEQVDGMRPWLVQWIAERIGALYLDVTEIPKN